MPQTVKRILSLTSTILVILVVLLAILLVGTRLVGIKPYTVLSGSMEPTYHVGSLIYVKEVDINTLQEGDPLTYVIDGGTVVTHRITQKIVNEKDPTDIRFKTKGDANNFEDGQAVRGENVLGKPLFSIPLLGYFTHFIQNPPGSYLAIGVCGVIVLLTFLPDLLDKIFEEAPPAESKPEDEQESHENEE